MKVTPSLKTEAAAIAIKAKKLGLSQSDIAIAIGASQSQVSRVLSGSARRRSRLFKDVCGYVNSLVMTDSPKAEEGNDELMKAVSAVWDGTPQHAKALSIVIRSLGALTANNASKSARQLKHGKG